MTQERRELDSKSRVWSSIAAGEIIHGIVAGKNLRCEERPPASHERGVLKVSAVTWGKFDPLAAKTLPPDFIPPSQTQVRVGDFLISRANTLELVGAVVVVDQTPPNLFLSDKILRLEMADEDKPWMLWFLRSPHGRRAIESSATGNQLSMRNISQQALRTIEVPWPSDGERCEITRRIDSLSAKSKRARDHLDHLPRLVEKYKQAILADVFSSIEGPSFCLNDIALSDAPIRYGVIQPGEIKDVGVPLIRVCDLQNGHIAWSDLRRISSDIDARYADVRIQTGDVLISVVGTIGRVALVSVKPLEPTNIARAVARIRPDPGKVLSEWLAWRLQSRDCQNYFLLEAREVARKTLNIAQLKDARFHVPSLTQQARAVASVTRAFAWIDRLASEAASARKLIGHLDHGILAKAFRGELVPQDPADEPARVLLDRIRTARSAAAGAPARTRRRNGAQDQ
jgi:type I restriction enzyme S subunit